MAAEITLAVSMPWDIRPEKGVAAANSSLTCIALLSQRGAARRSFTR
jgi:hypothetical protein